MLGHDFVRQVPKSVEVRALRTEVDLTTSKGLAKALSEMKPRAVINAAAYTHVDRAESEPDLAFRVNGVVVGELGKRAIGNETGQLPGQRC